MLHIEVNLLATFKAIAGINKLVLEMESGQTAREAFSLVLQKVPSLKSHWLGQDGQPQIYVHIYLNGNDTATLPDGMDTGIKNGDILDFIPPVAGG